MLKEAGHLWLWIHEHVPLGHTWSGIIGQITCTKTRAAVSWGPLYDFWNLDRFTADSPSLQDQI